MRGYKVFSGNANIDFAEKVVKKLNLDLGKATVEQFSDGEINIQIKETVRGLDTFIIQPTSAPTNDHFMELLIIADALKRSSANSITAVIPYFGYARQDRKAAPRVPITAKLIADMIETSGIDRIITVDLHAAQIQGFFNIPVDNLFGLSLFVEYVKNKNLKNPIVVSPDIGGVARARTYANALGVDLVIVDKKRDKANHSEIMNIIGDVKGKDVILVDDMIDTAGTLVNAAKILKERGAISVMACCTHGVLSGPAYKRIDNGQLDELIITDTIKIDQNGSKKITQLSAAPMIAETIRRIYNNESVFTPFDVTI